MVRDENHFESAGAWISDFESIDYLGTQSGTIEIQQARKGTKLSRAQSFDYLGAVSENFGDRVCLTSGSTKFDFLVPIEFRLGSIPPVAGRGPCLAPDFATGLHEVPLHSIPGSFSRIEKTASKFMIFVHCLSNTVELNVP
jgi:hypothetical protein